MIGTKINEFIRGLLGGIISIPLMLGSDLLDVVTGLDHLNVEDIGLIIGIVIFLSFLVWI